MLLLGLLLAPAVRADDIAAGRAKNALTEVDGVRVLTVTGTPFDRGYIHGYNLARDIVIMLGQLASRGGIVGGSAAYESSLLPLAKQMSISEPHKNELRGIFDGIVAKLGGSPVITSLARVMSLDDLLAINCVADALAMSCSSFVAWGSLTADGNTIAGRNLDWFQGSGGRVQELVLVQAADPAKPSLGWVSITWPGLIGCYTGINSEGVTVSVHDAPGGKASQGDGSVPRTFALRDAIEAAHASSVIDDIKGILSKRRVAVGNNVPVTMPYTGKMSPAVVFEYDGNVAQGDGVTVRLPGNAPYQMCTNHFRTRAKPTACPRYDAISEALESASREHRKLTVEDAWDLLASVAFGGRRTLEIITLTSVVFEPNKLKMHVAFGVRGKPAPYGKHVTLDVARLLRRAAHLREPE